jgi:hypothetical protein
MKKAILGLLLLIGIFYTTVLILPRPGEAYVYNGHRLSGTSRNYTINTDSFTGYDANTVINDVEMAAQAWPSQSSMNFKFVYAGTTSNTTTDNDGTSTVFAQAGTGDCGCLAETYWWYDGTNYIVSTHMRFWLGAVTWYLSNAACSTGEWFYQVGTHEWGHALGLGHSDVVTATMHAGIGYCDQTEYSLDPDDILAVNTVYGSVPSPTPAPSPSPSPDPTPAPIPSPTPTGATLNVRAYKVKGLQKADLTWTGLSTSTVDVYRNNAKILSGTSNDGFQTDAINKKGSANYTYKVCELASTDNCTNTAQAIF